MSLGQLLTAISINDLDDAASAIVINDLVIDSRNVTGGSLFCAYPGSRADGRDFIQQALQAGAAAVICEAEGFAEHPQPAVPIIMVTDLKHKIGIVADHFFSSPSTEMQVFGVTGTNGKTTCCYLLTQALTELGLRAVMIGTIGAGNLAELSYSHLTTPDPVALQRQLAEWRDQGITQVCMEVSSHALDQGRVAGTQFFCTMFTNLTHDHLDYHGNMERYAAAKLCLFTEHPSELVITNLDDEFGASLIELANSDFIASYGSGGDVAVVRTELAADGMTLTLQANGMTFMVGASLIGKINVPNILLLVTTLLSLSTSVEDIQRIVAQLTPAPGRMELFSNERQARVVVDFAHTPDALEKALKSVREHCVGQLWCVFGCGGDRDKAKRAVMGAAAAQHADRIVVTNDNPRSEAPEMIAKDILAGINNSVVVELDRAKAIRTAIKQAASDDWILVAGRGHEPTQHIGEKHLPFSDREHVAKLLRIAA
ncbi:MAG: UDP-N-acetylmuramoyl-L-alanyl-D-glutamate--2,6-diaminopimelate ligase [Gammaproteobacteria bacterium]|nr:UDP-N-acetylmuramoyl-L-alanyl-D-glutamate--2,6-diaminopimelate ligase [Gammaproteobacteria bacterium]